MAKQTRRTLSIGALITLAHAALFPQSATDSLTRRLIDSVSLDSLGVHIRALESAGGHYSRVNFTPGNDSGAAYIRRGFDALPYLTSVESDTFYISSATPPLNTKPLVNVIGTLSGKMDPSRVIVLGAHLDCSASREGSQVWNPQWSTIRAPGADDNASGVAAVLEIARILSDTTSGFTNDYTVRFVAFGAEESGPAYSGSHHGSMHYAEVAKSGFEDIIAMISIDMIGFNRQYYYQSIISDTASTWLAERFVAANDSNSIGLTTSSPPFPYATYSDHASFWSQGYPAICLIEYAPPWNNGPYYRANPYYHTSEDSLGTLNLHLVQKVTQMTLAAVVSLNSTTTGTERQVAQAPSRYALYQNYPNPFNPVTTIRFSIPQDELVTLAVYDITGREVATLLNYHLSAGTYTVQWNARAAASGVYYCRMSAGTFLETKKLMVLR